MELRLRQLVQAVHDDKAGRLAADPKDGELHKILEEIDAHGIEMCKAEQMHRDGILPKRICHCDTKVNNMMFDQNDNVLCVIDLDTVMPNFIFSDYGDFLRTAANLVAEDCPDMESVGFRMDIFEAFTEGYLKSAGGFLTPTEVENLPYAVALFPYMQCVRFLWDYMSGDHYWKCQYPTHNFVRANNQFHLLLSIEKHQPQMEEFIRMKLNK
jgi:Ser/Thr protein kinase RdoA (MazF antagonist)